MPRANWGFIGNLEIPFPPDPEEQRTIAAFLDRQTAKIDALIAKKRELIAALHEKRSAIISHAVTKGLNPDAPMKDSGIEWLGEIPAGWDVVKIKYLAQIGNGSTPLRDNEEYWHEGTFPWITSTVVNDDVVGEPTQFVTERALRECHLPIVRPQSVLVAITGQGKTRGMAAVLHYEATINQHLVYISPRSDLLLPEFLQLFLSSVYDILRIISEGAGSTRGALTVEQIANFAVFLPPTSEQWDIVKYISEHTAEIDAMTAKIMETIERLQEYRSALISATVTGRIDVRGEISIS
jgi:type I restriction enzyme S subunit